MKDMDLENKFFKINSSMIKIIKEDKYASMLLSYFAICCNKNDLCNFTIKQLVQNNGYIAKRGNNENVINNKLKNTIRILILHGYISLMANPYTKEMINDLNNVDMNDEIWIKYENPVESYIMVDTQDYYKLINYCYENKIKINLMLDVYLYVVKHINRSLKNGKCNVSYSTMTESLNASNRDIKKVIDKLIEIKLLYKKNGNTKNSNEYYLKTLN